ncbi:GAF domain-containing protein [Natroniella sulfidigena]|nr:GAF domain-containing protein [Natroniella sulfidigena]
MISDTDKIIASSTEMEKYNDQVVGDKIKEAMSSRKTIVIEDAEEEELFNNFRTKEGELGAILVTPIIKQGDILGTVVLSSSDKELGDFETKISEITAKVISKKLGL